MEFEITDLIEAIDDYKEAKESHDNNPNPEYGIGTHEAKSKATEDLNKAFRKAVKSVLTFNQL